MAMVSAKAAVQEFWDSKPCGSRETAGQGSLADYFQAHADLRYTREPEILSFAEFDNCAALQVLEIGVGMGADFVRFGKAGASVLS